MSFVNLHNHSCYSLLDGAQTPKQMVERAKELGQSAIALTDHGNMHGVIKFWDECKKGGVKPIIGMEAYQAPVNRNLKEPIKDIPPAFHITLLAKNTTGLTNLYKLSSRAYFEGFYHKPRVDHELLTLHGEGLICLSGCLNGKIQWYLRAYVETEDKEWLKLAHDEAWMLKDIFGKDFFMEFQRIIPIQEKIIPLQIDICSSLDIHGVATCDAHYARPEDVDFHEQILCLSTGKTIKDEDRMRKMGNLHLKSEEEMRETWKGHPVLIDNTQAIADICNLPDNLYGKKDYIFPAFGENDEEEFEAQCWIGLKARGLDDNKEYVERLKYEIETVKDMGFPSYFLVVSDYVCWAKEHGITVGPGRGSAAGSLASYALGITDVDPLEYGLLFQRFLNKGRKSMPDIDVDFCMHRRGEVIAYLAERYGQEKVAQITTFSEFKPRGACRDFARVQGEPYALGEKASKLVPPASRGREPTWAETISASRELLSSDFNDVISMARKSEGLNKGRGIHAGGVVISLGDFEEVAPRCLGVGKNKEIASQWDMDDLERVGLVKMDILGLTSLTVIDKTLSLISSASSTSKSSKESTETLRTSSTQSTSDNASKLKMSQVPRDDQKTFDLIARGDTSGLFQLDGGGGIRTLCMQLRPQSISEISAISALYRPGPLDSGVAAEYVARVTGKSPVTYLVPELEPVLKMTYGLLVYQEQAMRIATDLAGYDLESADDLRKAIGKKLPEKMAKEEEKLISGMTERGIAPDKARELWQMIKVFADYGFNKTLDKDTKVCTIEGIKKIEDCKPGDTVFTWADDNTVKHAKVVALHDHGKVPLWEVEFDDGSIEKCTLDHKWLTEYGQLPLWEILQLDIPVWGSPIYEARAPGASTILFPMHSAKKDQREALFLSGMPEGVSISSTISNTQEGVREVPLFSEEWKARTEAQEDAMWSQLIYDTMGSQTAQTELPGVPEDTRTNQDPELQRFRTYTRNAQEILRDRQENICKTRNPTTESRETGKLESYTSRRIQRNNKKDASVSKEIQDGDLAGTNPQGVRVQKKCPDKMRSIQEETSRLCESYKENSCGGRRTLALHEYQGTSLPSRGSGKRQDVRGRDIKARLEINPSINGELQEQLWRTYISRPRSTGTSNPRRPVARYTLLRKPIRVRFCGFEQGYDLEVDHPAHNFFLASGHCCSNSHAVAYSFITYYTAYLKANYPVEFYCALLTLHYDNREKLMEYLGDCRKADLQVLAPDVNESGVGFAIHNGVIRFGLSAIRDVGPKVARQIVLAREDGPFEDIFNFYERVRTRGVNKRTIEALAKAGALTSLNVPRASVLEILDDLVGYRKEVEKYEKKMQTYQKRTSACREREAERAEAQAQGKKGKPPLKEPQKPEPPPPVRVPDIDELEIEELMRMEKEMLGLYITSHPLYSYEADILKYTNAHTASLGDHSNGEHVSMLGVISHVKHITTRAGRKMAVIDLEDLHGHIEVTIFSRLYANVQNLLEEENVVLLAGKVEASDENVRKLIATNIKLLPKKTSKKKVREPKHVRVYIDEAGEVTEEMIQKLNEIMDICPGNIQTSVDLQLGGFRYKLDRTAGVSYEGVKQLKKQPGILIKTNRNKKESE